MYGFNVRPTSSHGEAASSSFASTSISVEMQCLRVEDSVERIEGPADGEAATMLPVCTTALCGKEGEDLLDAVVESSRADQQ